MKRFIIIVLFFMVMLFTINAYAQETNSTKPEGTGILAYTSGNTNSIGFIYNFVSNLAVRPSFLLYQQDLSLEHYGVSVDLLYYIKQKKSLFIYTGIGLSYNYDYTYYKYPDGSTDKYRADRGGCSFIIGAQYMFTEQFGLFADTGISYSLQRERLSSYDSTSVTTSNHKTWNNTFNFRSSNIGAVFYLK